MQTLNFSINLFLEFKTKCYVGVEAVATAFVFINVETGSEREIVRELRKIPIVKEAYVTYGVYDIVTRVEAESLDKLKETLTANIRRLDNVRSTLTTIVAGWQQGHFKARRKIELVV